MKAEASMAWAMCWWRRGDGAVAEAAYMAEVAIREVLAKRQPVNMNWQVDETVSCSKLGSLNSWLPLFIMKEYLFRVRDTLISAIRAGQLHTN